MKIESKTLGSLNYLACFPESFSQDKTYPIIIHFHGAGSRGNDVEILKDQTIVRYSVGTENFPFVMFLPQCQETCWFDVFEQLKSFVQSVADLPFVDKNRIYLSGVSMGGYAAWQMLMSLNEIFCKAVICCGGGMYWNAARIKASVWAFHGTKDPVVYPEESQKMVDAVNRNGGNAKLTLYEGVEHNSWEPTYSNPEVYQWLLS